MFTITVKPDGQDPFDVTASTRDVLQWEKVGKDNSLTKLQNNPSVSDMYSIAHFACKRQQRFTGSLQDFEASVDIDFETEEDEEPDPTPGDR